jgi:murein L,D-transpeptidase YcbB/YkuD
MRLVALAAAALLAAAPAVRAQAPAAAPAARPDPLVEALRERVEAISSGSTAQIDGETIRSTRALPRLYEANGFRPLWDPPRLRSLLDAIEDAEGDGLRPVDYHYPALQRLAPGLERAPAVQRVSVDMLATDAYALLLYHLYFGKVDPVAIESTWNFAQPVVSEDEGIAFVLERIRANRVRSSLAEARPDNFLYGAGREALSQYRSIAALGGWPQIPAGPTLKPGMTDPRVTLLRERLALTGDFALVDRSVPPATPDTFDPALEQALRHFQRRHRIEVDGAVGPGTLRELNVPVERRIDQIRLNLERGRWVLHEVDNGELIVVDIAGFTVRQLRDRKVVWQTRAVVGKPYRETPIFRSAIDHVVFNPTWTVPPGIVAKDILPGLRRGEDVLRRKKLKVLDLSGREIPASSIQVPPPGSTRFPYILRQDAGPDNALGVVKIMFPNPHFVYLHDTPSKSLFDEDTRAFSSGCIRTERPLDLVERLFAADPQWNRAAIDAAVAAGSTRTVRLPKPVPVLLIYWTVDRDDDGSVVFRPDVYRRDARLLAALDAPFTIGRRQPL